MKIDKSHLNRHKQERLKIIFAYNIKIFFIVLSGFEPLSRAPKARRIDHYPTGLHVKAFTYRLILVLNFCARSGIILC